MSATSEPAPGADDPGLNTIEAALGALRPVSGRMDRDRVMFAAGQAAARVGARPRWAWPAATTALATLALIEAAALTGRPPERVVERVVVVHVPIESPPLAAAPAPALAAATAPTALAADWSWPDRTDAQRLQRRVFQFGLDALPERPTPRGAAVASGAASASAGVLLRSEIDRLLTPGEPS